MKLIPGDLVAEINRRIDSIRKYMAISGIDALLVSANSNIYYTTGRFFRGYVFISLDRPPLWFVIKPETFEPESYWIPIRKPEMIPSALSSLNYPEISNIGLELDSSTYSDVMRLMALFPDAKLCNGSVPLRKSRMIKTPWEIERMKEDGIHQVEAYRRIGHLYRSGMTDIEFQIEIERVLRLEGCLGVVRTSGNFMDINLGSVIAGDNADEPGPYDFTMGGAGVDPSHPVGANGKTIKRGETIMIDMNGSFNGYQTDMTRVWRLGDIPDIAYKAHDCSRKILHELERIALPGIPVADLYNKSIEIVEKDGLKDYFMGHKSKVSFIGHGIGIELNEPPVVMAKSKDILERNMTIALEPKFVIPGIGAVGIENSYVVEDTGLKNLTVFPEEIMEL